jgi:hypothetical protein
MSEPAVNITSAIGSLSPNVHKIVRHLCEGECHTFGSVLQWCETRGDCIYAVTCPSCSTQFIVEEDELAELERWTDANGHTLVCGVIYQ